jgi:hypothetical protein
MGRKTRGGGTQFFGKSNGLTANCAAYDFPNLTGFLIHFARHDGTVPTSCRRIFSINLKEKFMPNNDSSNAIELAITSTERALSALDSCAQNVAAHQEIISALEADVAALRTNTAGLDAKARGSKFTSTNSALALARSDLDVAQEGLSAQKAKVVAIGKAAASALFEARDALQTQRQSNVAAWLTAQFDWPAVPVVTPSDLAAVHQTVQAIGKLSVSYLFYELEHDDDTSVRALRCLGKHWAELKPLVESEPGLELSIAPIAVPQVAKPKPVVTSNQLGTLAQAIVAAGGEPNRWFGLIVPQSQGNYLKANSSAMQGARSPAQ